MRPEQSMWDALRPRLAALDPVRVENAVGDGTPDVNYTHGWIELKRVPSWPARASTSVHIEVRTLQAVFLVNRWRAGGLSWVMAQVASEWLLFPGLDASALRVGLPAPVVRRTAIWTTKTWTDQAVRSLHAVLLADTESMEAGQHAHLLRSLNMKETWEVAEELGVDPERIEAAEAGLDAEMCDDLLDHWEA
jgi:hypothetical protein